MAVSSRTRVIWFATAVLGGVGGLLGGLFWDLEVLKLLFVIAVSGFFALLVVLGWITRSPQPVSVEPQSFGPQSFGPSNPVTVAHAHGAGGGEHVGQVTAGPEVVAEPQWWEKSAAPAAVAVVPTAPEHSEFDVRPAQIAQCPRCASFELDACRVERGYAFRCRNPNCGNTWEWVLGTAWPAMVVRRNLSRRPPG